MQAIYQRAGDWLSLEHVLDDKSHGMQWAWDLRTQFMIKEVPYQLGVRHGIARNWHYNGRLKRETFFFRGVQQGLERAFHGNGNLMLEVLWVNGQKHGIERIWTLVGNIYKETSFYNGMMHGKEVFYHANGSIYGEAMEYYQGKPVVDGNLPKADDPFVLLGASAECVDEPMFGMERSDVMGSTIKEMVEKLNGEEEMRVEVDNVPRPSYYDMALGSTTALKVKKWHGDGVDPDEIRARLVGETKEEVLS